MKGRDSEIVRLNLIIVEASIVSEELSRLKVILEGKSKELKSYEDKMSRVIDESAG